MISKADLHVHSKYSEHLSEQFLRKMGAYESFTEPEFIYRSAKESGMRFVTITDHNRIEGSLLLHEKHPEDTFTGVESTVYFPEDHCRIHMLIFGLTAAQFEEIQRLRNNVYDLRDYLKANDLTHSIAHATYYKGNELRLEHLEKLILLFDVFEAINGGRSRMNNRTWENVLNSLSPSHIEDLYRKHRIEPFSDTPWKKGFTGGSDDHAGLFSGRTYTLSNAKTAGSFLQSIKQKKTEAGGKHNDFQSFAFTIYKIAYDFSKTKTSATAPVSLLGRINQMIFEKKPLRLRDKLAFRGLRYRSRRKNDRIQNLLFELVDTYEADKKMPVDRRLDVLYDKVGAISDEFLRRLLESFSSDLQKGDVASVVENVSSSVLGALISLPFLMSFRYLYHGRELADELSARFPAAQPKGGRRILWFTDSLDAEVRRAITALNPADAPLEENLKIVTARGALDESLSPLIMNVPYIYELKLPQSSHALKVPSILQSLKEIFRYDPDEICISTPGPAGLLGILAAKLLNARCVGVYDTTYHLMLRTIADNESLAGMFESYTRWFYSHMDEIRVPTLGHLDILENAGLNRAKMNVFREEALLREIIRGATAERGSSLPKDLEAGQIPA